MPGSPLVPGAEGSPIPAGLRVIRMANEPKVAHLNAEAVLRMNGGKALPSFFELSSEDKQQPIPRLSVWVEVSTSVPEAWNLVGADPVRRWVVWLITDRIRSIAAPKLDASPPTPSLDVQWERATTLTDTGERVPDNRPGWEGHAGIAHLEKGNKTQRAALRMQLADCAEVQILTNEQLVAFSQTTSQP